MNVDDEDDWVAEGSSDWSRFKVVEDTRTLAGWILRGSERSDRGGF